MSQEKIFSSSVLIPDWWFTPCKMEPNLGIHKYHQKKTAELLEGKQWICNGEHLQMSDGEGIQLYFMLYNFTIIHENKQETLIF